MLTPEQRINNYTRDGRVYLTAKQGRRYTQKWRKFMQCADDDAYYEIWKDSMYKTWYGDDYVTRSIN